MTKSENIHIRATPAEKRLAENLARRRGMNVSELVLSLLAAEKRRQAKVYSPRRDSA